MKASYDKATTDLIKSQFTSEVFGITVIVTIRTQHEFDGPLPYPLTVGKQIKVTEIEETMTTSFGETETNTYNDEIEVIEDITAPAGTFRTFKAVKYDESGSKLYTVWLADAVRAAEIKSIDHETGETSELTSYTLVDES